MCHERLGPEGIPQRRGVGLHNLTSVRTGDCILAGMASSLANELCSRRRYLDGLGGLGLGLALSAVGCGPSETPRQGPVYRDRDQWGGATARPVCRWAVHPLHNPRKLFERYQPLIEWLNLNVPHVRWVLEASRDYPEYERKYRARAFEFILPNPWQTLDALKFGYHVIAMAGHPGQFKGLLIVRRDSHFKSPLDLKGRTISYPAPTALAACMMPQAWLKAQGLDVLRQTHSVFVGSHESTIMNVYLGRSAAGGTWPPPWRVFQNEHPKEAAELMLAWETPSLVNTSVMVRDDVSPLVRDATRQALLRLADTREGAGILVGLDMDRFHPAQNSTYEVVREYVARFEREIRPVESL